MSRVYLVQDGATGQDVALKILNDDSAASLGAEFRFIASLNHPGVISVHDFGLTPDGRPYFTMDLVEGGDLVEFADAAPLRQAVRAVRGVFETLDFVHARGIVHGDLKPANILMAATPEGKRFPKLLDFGIATFAREGEAQVSGTVNYMAPELILHKRRDALTDLYAMGAVLFEMFTGELLFDGPTALNVLRQHLKQAPVDPVELRPELRGKLGDIILRLLEKAPEDRFQRGREVVAALDAWLNATLPPRLPIGESEPPPSLTGKVHEPAERARWLVAAPRVRMAGGARFVGRETELDRVIAAALQLIPKKDGAQRSGSLIVLTAPPGAGKTRLLQEMRVRVQLAGVGCLAVEFKGCRSPAEALERLSATIAGAAGKHELLEDTRSLLAGTEATALASAGTPWTEAAADRSDLLNIAAEQLASACIQQAQVRPVVLTLDGVDDIGEEANIAIRSFVEEVIRSPVVVILSGLRADEGLLAQVSEMSESEAIERGRRDRSATDQIVRSLLGEMAGSAAIIEHVHAESGGNPGATAQVVRALVASGAVVMRQAGWEVAAHLGGRLPRLTADAELREIARGSLQPLTGQEHRVAEAAANIGMTVDVGLLSQVLQGEVAREGLDPILGALVRANVLEPPIDALGLDPGAAQHRFAHRATRDVLLEACDVEIRRQWSRRIVAVLEGASATSDPGRLETLTRHLAACGRIAEAARRAGELVRQAISAGLVTDAPEHLRSALGSSPGVGGLDDASWCGLACLLAEYERRRGRPEEAMDWYRKVVELAKARGTAGESSGHGAVARHAIAASGELGDLMLERGDTTGEETLQHALREARALGEGALVGRAAYVLANRQVLAGNHDAADAGVAEALAVAEGAGDRALRARVLKLRATLSWYRGRLTEAERDAREAAVEYEALGMRRGAAVALGALGNALFSRGQLEHAGQAYRDALVHARAARWLVGIGKLENALALVAFPSGDFDGAYEHWRAALTIANRTHNRVEQVILMNNIGLVAALRGEDDAATRLYEDALALARSAGFPKGEALVLGNLGELHCERGNAELARSCLDDGTSIARRIDAKALQIECERRHLELRLAAPELLGATCTEVYDDAIALMGRAEHVGTAGEIPHIRRVAAQALAATSTGNDEAAVQAAQLLEDAASGFEDLGSRFERARVIRVAAELAAGGMVEAERLAGRLGEARKLFRRLGAQPELDRVRRIEEDLVERPVFVGRKRAEHTRPLPAGQALRAAASPPDRRAPSSDTAVERPLEPQVVASLLEVIRGLSSIDDLEALLARIVDEALRLTQTERGFFMLCDQDERPAFRVSRGMGGAELGAEQVQLSRTVLDRALQTRLPIVVQDVTGPSGRLLGKSVFQLGLQAVACLPVHHQDQLVGVLYLDSTSVGEEWTSEALSLLDLFLRHAAIAVNHARRAAVQRRQLEMVATGAHELANPLRALIGHVRLLRAELDERGGAGAASAAVVQDQAVRLSRMVSVLIDQAGAEPKGLAWTAVSIQVKDLTETAAEQIRPLAAINGVQLEVLVPPGMPTMFGNRDRLIQATANLLATAVGLSRAGGRVELMAQAVRPDAVRGRAPDGGAKARDPLLPAPDQGYELSEDVLIRIDAVCLGQRGVPGPDEPPESAPTMRVRDAVFAQLALEQGLAHPNGADKDPALSIAQRVVSHHGGQLWAEPSYGGGARLSMLFPTLVQAEEDRGEPER